LIVVLLVVVWSGLLAPAALAAPPEPAVQVSGAVAAPASYSAADLAALPRATYPLAGGGTVSGVDLRDLVLRAGPRLPAAENPQLRVLLTVTGRGPDVPFALGELDPDVGAHPAVLTVADGRVQLVVPGDRTPARSLPDVTGVRVAVSDAGPSAPPAGSVVVGDGNRTTVVNAERLSRLPARTLTVTFRSGTGVQTHTERGPALAAVLAVAGMPVGAGTSVVAVGSDGYGAAVTLGEYYFGGRTLLLSTAEDGADLAQPRLVTPGDVQGGRYASGVVALSVG
jgi:hypothetical protein